VIKVRASSADRIMLCNYSSINPTVKYDNSGPWSLFGQAGHEVLAEVVKHDLTRLPDISPALDKYEIEDERSLRISIHIGLKEYVETIRPSINRDHLISEEKQTRQLRNKYLLTGHPDIACLLNDGETLFVGDWKFGDVANHWNQLKAYAFILLYLFPGVKQVLLGAYFLRVNEKSVKEFSKEYIEGEWADEFYNALEGDSYKPCFDACKYCPVLNCEAGDNLGRSTMSSLATVNDSESTALAMASKYEDVQLVERHIQQYKNHLKNHLMITGESITTESGKVLSLIDGHKSTLYLHEAIGVLGEYFGAGNTDQLLKMLKDVVTIKKTDLMELVGRHAAYRMKGKEKKRITEEMELSGAIKTKSYKKLALKKGD